MTALNVDNRKMVRVDEQYIKDIVIKIFLSMDFSYEDSRVATDVLIRADKRGVISHGISRQLRVYMDEYNQGKINSNPKVKFQKNSDCMANIDGDKGLGIITAPKDMEIAIKKASSKGIGMVTVYNSRHLGMASYHSMLALPENMIGICVSGCPPRCFPTFGAEKKLGTNPISIA